MDRLEAIERLARLRDNGVLTEEEFTEQKQILMSASSANVIPAPFDEHAVPAPILTSPIRPPQYQSNFSASPHFHVHSTQAQSPYVQLRYDAAKKSVAISYLFWFFLWPISMHRIYLRKWFTALLQIIIGWVWIILLPGSWVAGFIIAPLIGQANVDRFYVGGLAIWAVALPVWWIWLMIDAVLIPRMVRQFNQKLIETL